jgi:hypothetical protein
MSTAILFGHQLVMRLVDFWIFKSCRKKLNRGSGIAELHIGEVENTKNAENDETREKVKVAAFQCFHIKNDTFFIDFIKSINLIILPKFRINTFATNKKTYP